LRWALLVLVAVVAIVRFLVAGATPGPVEGPRPAAIAHYGVQLPRGPLGNGTARGGGAAISPDSESEDTGTVTDLQGDEISSAVAKYRLDQEGNLYELHAPHTEVAKLPSPVG
jgi:hypothetical protein